MPRGHCEEMIGIHQFLSGDDAVPVGIRVAGKGQVKIAPHLQQAVHGIRGRAVHADLAVLVAGHKAEGGVHLPVHDDKIQTICLGNGLPQRKTRATQRIHAQLEARRGDGLHVEHLGEIFHIGAGKIKLLHQGRRFRLAQMDEPDRAIARLKILVGGFFYPGGNVGFRRAAVGRIVFEAAVTGRIVRRGDDDAVRQAVFPPGIPAQDGMGNGRSGRIGAVLGDADMDAVGHQHLKGRAKGRLRKRMGIPAEKQGAINAFGRAIIADRLRDGVDVLLIEGVEQRGAAMPRSTEGDTLPRYFGVGKFRVVGAHQRGNAFELFGRGQMTGIAMHNRHRLPPAWMMENSTMERPWPQGVEGRGKTRGPPHRRPP